MRKIVLVLSIVLASWANGAATQQTITITKPRDGESVSQRPIIEGRVSDPGSTVWVIVHPLEVSDYWVQPRVTVRSDGSWKVQIHIGRTGNVDVGKVFEIMAVASPETELEEGKILPNWPKARATSDIIEVNRR